MQNSIQNTKKGTIGLSFGHFTIEIYAALLVPLYPIITGKLNIDLATISFIIALAHFCSSIMQPYFGFISDKLNHRIFLVWGLIMACFFIPIATKFNAIIPFTICLVTGMFGNALFHPQASSLMREFNENNPKISLSMGIFLGLGTLGYATGPYLGAFICEHFQYEKVFYTFIIGLIYAVFMYFYVPKMKIKEQVIKEKFSKIIVNIFKNKVCALLFIISMMKSIVSICFSTFLPFLLQAQGYSLSKIGIIITLFFVAGGIASFTSSRFEKKIGTKNTIALSMNAILPLTVAFLILLKYSFILSTICFVLIGYFILLSVGIILNQAQRAMPEYTGVISGIIQGAGWGIGALFLTPMGYFGQTFGIGKILFLISLIAFIIGLYCIKSNILTEK